LYKVELLNTIKVYLVFLLNKFRKRLTTCYQVRETIYYY
jgi:hypothetical protein